MKNFKNQLPMFLNLVHRFKKVTMFSLFFLWLGYLVSINHAAGQSFEMDALSGDLKQVNQDILLLNVKATSLQSIERIEGASKNLNLVKTNDIYYLTDHQGVVALR